MLCLDKIKQNSYFINIFVNTIEIFFERLYNVWVKLCLTEVTMFLSTLANATAETENVWGLSLNVLVTGIVVVFVVLLLLILLIKLYSTIVYKAQNRTPKAPKSDDGNVAKSAVMNNGAMAITQPQGLTDELIAVITAAAVACMGNSNIRVTGIRKRTQRSEWSDAGLRESVQPFRMGDWK